MRTSVTLGFMALLAACGGSGTPTVEPEPVPPEPALLEPEPAPPESALPEPEPVPPEPVTFDFDTSARTALSVTADTFVFDGVTYNISDLTTTFDDGNRTILIADARAFYAIQLVDGDASIAAAATTQNFTGDPVPQPDGSRFDVPLLENIPVGSATFSGEYAGLLINRARTETSYDTITRSISGDVTLNVEFADYLSESSFSGVISNREFRRLLSVNGDFSDTFAALNDIVIEDGRIDDVGQFTGSISGGEIRRLEAEDVRFARYEANNGDFIGQFGGEGGEVAAGTLRFEHSEYDTDIDLTGVERLDREFVETGGFVARQD